MGYDSASGTWNVVQRYVYDSYGNITMLNADWSATPTGTQPMVNSLYQGMQYDPVTGLYYGRARWYSTSLGRWTSQDPAGYINGANTYQFVMSRPVGQTDSSGRWSWPWQWPWHQWWIGLWEGAKHEPPAEGAACVCDSTTAVLNAALAYFGQHLSNLIEEREVADQGAGVPWLDDPLYDRYVGLQWVEQGTPVCALPQPYRHQVELWYRWYHGGGE